MKLSNIQNNRFKNTYESEQIQFAISEKEQKHIMTMLRDQIYSDKILAPIREYCCNAFDANIEVGKTLSPIDIRIPTSIEPTWSVRDYGPGLTHDEIKNIFTKYGESTKRNSNDVTGCLGIGSKSAFAYTDQFTVTSYKNGKRLTYVAAIDDNGNAIIHLADIQEHSSDHGVKITIPVKPDDISTFKKRTLSFLKSIHLAGTPYLILNEDIEITGIDKHYEAEDKTWYIAGSDEYHEELDYGNAKIIMGHVCYEIDTGQLEKMGGDVIALAGCSNLFMKMPLGSLSIAASRESLEYNDQTLAYLYSMLPDIKRDVQGVICHDIIHAKNIYEATRSFNTAHNDLPYPLRSIINDLEHKATGEKITQNLKFYKTRTDGSQQPMNCDEYIMRTLRSGNTQVKKSERQYLRPEHNTVLFHNDNMEGKSKRGRRIKAYLTTNPTHQLIMVNEDWADIKNSTMSSYMDTIQKISTIEPLPINYSNKNNGIGVKGPSKASGELFAFDVENIRKHATINRDLFEPIEDTQQYWDDHNNIYSVQINGFRYAGTDEKYIPDPDNNHFDKHLILDLWNLIKTRHDIETSIVAYRPKHEKAFGTIKPFFPFAIQTIKQELKGNPGLAWELLIKRENIPGIITQSGYDHNLTDLLEHLHYSKFTPLRNLSTLLSLHESLNERAPMNKLNELLHTLNINPSSYTRKQIPDIRDLTEKTLEKYPILNWINHPYELKWRSGSATETQETELIEAMKTIIK